MSTLSACLLLGALGVPAPQGPQTWIVLGPFQNLACATTASGAVRSGVDPDFLTSIGGEAKAAITASTVVGAAKAQPVQASEEGIVNLRPLYTPSDNLTAYAYSVVDAPKDESRLALFGSDDGAKVWVNGDLVHSVVTAGRAMNPDEETFTVKLRKGPNAVMVKVENGGGDWGFSLRILDEAAQKALLRERDRRRVPEFTIEVASESGRILRDTFPTLRWREPSLASAWVSEPKVRWFDPSLASADAPSVPGLYLAVVEAATLDGKPWRQTLPFFKPQGDWLDRVAFPPMTEQPFPTIVPPLPVGMAVDPKVWAEMGPSLNEAVWQSFGSALKETSIGASFLAYVTLQRTGPAPKLSLTESSEHYFTQQALTLRRKLENRTGDPLAKPTTQSVSATTLKRGTAEAAGLPPGIVSKLDKLCKEWSRKEGVPFSALVARNGVVFFEGAYGKWDGKPTKKDQVFYPASIGKAMAGAVMSQFYDQGLVNPDGLVSDVLTAFPKDPAITPSFRGCFAHLSGLDSHMTYNGLWNPWLDHSFLVGRIGSRRVGEIFRYGGDGNNLAGMAMELLTGRTMVRLLKEQLFDPLGMTHTVQFDLGFGVASTAWDTAIFGQMLLNKGAYGKLRFYSEDTALKTRPVPIAPYFPNLQDKSLWWGAGLSHMIDVADGTATRERNELGPNVFGHGSASSSIFRVDPDHGYVIVMGRQKVGDAVAHERYRGLFMRALREAVKG